jgi:hypothetical protein
VLPDVPRTDGPFCGTKTLTPEIADKWAKQADTPDLNIQRRHHRQNLYPELVKVLPLWHQGTPTTFHGLTRDISKAGIGLTTRQKVCANELVDLEFYIGDESYMARARVMHCTPIFGGYSVGLQFAFA